MPYAWGLLVVVLAGRWLGSASLTTLGAFLAMALPKMLVVHGTTLALETLPALNPGPQAPPGAHRVRVLTISAATPLPVIALAIGVQRLAYRMLARTVADPEAS